MPTTYTRKARRYARGATRKARPSVPKPAPKAVVTAVKRVLSRQEETKAGATILENGTAHNAAITSGDVVGVLPSLGNGTSSADRVGDKIRPVSLRITGATSFNDYGEGFVGVPLVVKVMCLQAKGIRDPTALGGVDTSNLLDNAGTTNWDGSTIRSMYRINTDMFQVLGTRTFKLGDSTAENPKCMSKRWSMNIKCPKVLTYSPGSSYPQNFAPFFVLGWARDDGTTPSIGQTWVKNTANAMLQYKDA